MTRLHLTDYVVHFHTSPLKIMKMTGLSFDQLMEHHDDLIVTVEMTGEYGHKIVSIDLEEKENLFSEEV